MSGELPILSEVQALQFVDGFQIPATTDTDAFRSAIQYKPRDDDVFIVTYPKCGAYLTHTIVQLILRHGKPAESVLEYFSAMPLLEAAGARGAENMPRPGAIKTHLPFHLTPCSHKAKYIYVTRNPKDTCFSCYHLMKDFQEHAFDGTFDQFFELFLTGQVIYGDYFDHLMEWYKHKNSPNVLFMTYEEMKENPKAAVLKLASFIDEEVYARALREDPEKMENVLQFSSSQYMKESLNQYMKELFSMDEEEVLKSDFPEHMKEKLAAIIRQSTKQAAQEKSPSDNFIRKGLAGNWKSYFSENQSKRMDQKFAKRTKGTDLKNVWKNYI